MSNYYHSKFHLFFTHFVCLVLIIFGLSFCGCSHTKSVDVLDHLILDQALCEGKFYLGDTIFPEDYELTLVYKSGLKKIISLSETSSSPIHLDSEGEKTITFVYENCHVSVTIEVLKARIIGGRYAGDTITINKGEKIEDVEVILLYSNGDEKREDINNLEFGNVDYTLDGQERILDVHAGDVTIHIPYLVSCREIELNKEYSILYNGTQYTAKIIGGEIYTLQIFGTSNDKTSLFETMIIGASYNQYMFDTMVKGERNSYLIYLAYDTIIIEPLL